MTHIESDKHPPTIKQKNCSIEQMKTKSTLEAEATTGGGSVFEKRYGLDFCLSMSIRGFGPVV